MTLSNLGIQGKINRRSFVSLSTNTMVSIHSVCPLSFLRARGKDRDSHAVVNLAAAVRQHTLTEHRCEVTAFVVAFRLVNKNSVTHSPSTTPLPLNQSTRPLSTLSLIDHRHFPLHLSTPTSNRHLIPTQEAGNALVTPLGLQVAMGCEYSRGSEQASHHRIDGYRHSCNPRGGTNTLPSSWQGIGYQVEERDCRSKTTGTLHHWTKHNSRSCYFRFVFSVARLSSSGVLRVRSSRHLAAARASLANAHGTHNRSKRHITLHGNLAAPL
ncbi:hypothetical protein EVAR_96063_1 [Eumeta japonica]|uniref:Uncharacterized protein n=1 Tax=Eumeta variegata TaxID=151549 RepID=A0A4C1W6X3_EUMVA|nr:hypothetical protein EVAR_96063_1 [Eumeta japonica]